MRDARARPSRLFLAGLLLAGLGGWSQTVLAQVKHLVLSQTQVHMREGVTPTATFTVALAAAPSGNVTVAVTSADAATVSVQSGASLTFTTSNYATAQTVTLESFEDDDGDDESVTVNLAASGGGYDSVSRSVNARVKDNDAKFLKLSENQVFMREGVTSTATFTVALATAPSGNVTVSVTSADALTVSVQSGASLTFTTENYATAQTVTLESFEDDDGDDESVKVNLAASGGGYDNVSSSVNARVKDNDAKFLKLSENQVFMREGVTSTATFTVALTTAPSGNVTVSVTSADAATVSVQSGASLTFTTENYATAQTVTLESFEDDDGDDESVRVNLAASGGGYDNVSSSVNARVKDTDARFLILSKTQVDMREGTAPTATFTVALTTAPSGDVTVTVTSADAATVSVQSGASLTFTTENYATAQTVTLESFEDDDGDDENVTVNLIASGGGYDSLSSSVNARVKDTDVKWIILSSYQEPIREGSTYTFTVTLATKPSGNVTVAVTSTDTAVSVREGASLTFTTDNYDTGQKVTLESLEDADGDNENVKVNLAASGGGYDSVTESFTAVVNDRSVKDLIMSPNNVTIIEGATATFTVKLATAPSSDVTVLVTSTDAAVSVKEGASLTFTTSNYDAAQTVTLESIADDDGDDESVKVNLAASGGGYDRVSRTVSARVADINRKALIVSPNQVSMNEGSTATFTVALATAPSGDVTVAVTSTDTAVSVKEGASLTFTTSNYDTAQTVTLESFADDDGDDESVKVNLAGSGGGYDRVSRIVSARVADTDRKALIVSPNQVSMKEGSTATFTVALATAPSGNVTVAVTSADAATVSVQSGASLTFTSSNYDTAQTVTLESVADDDGDDESVKVNLAGSGGGYDRVAKAIMAKVTDGNIKALTVSPSQVSMNEGDTATFTVTLATAPSGDVTVAVTSTDTAVSVKEGASLTFTTSNYATGQTVTLESFADDDGDDENVTVNLAASGGGYDRVASSVAAMVTDNDTGTPPEPGPSATAPRQLLEHVLAAIAQATVDGATDMIGRRFDSAPGTPASTVAGWRVGSVQGAPEIAFNPRTGTVSEPGTAGSGARDEIGMPRRDVDASYGSDGDALLRGSAFTLSLAGESASAGGPGWTVWGRGDWRSFDGRRGGGDWDGKQQTGWLGVDGRLDERLMAGVAVSRGESEADYQRGEFEGRLETSLTTLWPYLQMRTNNGGAVRLVLGAGTGEAAHRASDGASDGTVEKEDLSLLAGSVSGRMPVARRSGFTLSAMGGASLARMETAASSSTSSLGGLNAKSWRLRAGVEGEHDGFALSSGSKWKLAPRGALALRQDGGDGVKGTGAEVSGGVRLSASGSRFGLDASGHWLVLHSEGGTREWGASLEARLAPGADGRGLSLALAPTWGPRHDSVLARAGRFDDERNVEPQRLSLTARASYGFAATGGLLTPFADMEFGGEARRQYYRTGIGIARNGVDAALTVGHRTGGEPDTRIGLDLRLHF